ncbi:MAG: GGDEF domain-containing protein [Methylotenera sp.]|uniref:GGDEF domain-containing protein n=1 Tax=Methylotenera sp. TaxID=2051956 RepID=UPI002488E575|nr:diguanylate cyclase [Methylotenera sp.]MDI1309546.1 GGDEF domain-containing protein [Methylotenera sp.]
MAKLRSLINFILTIAICLVALQLSIQSAYATPQHLLGTWHLIHPYSADNSKADFLDNPLASKSSVVNSVGLTGGHYLYIASINITKYDEYVLDFKNTSTIGKFRHQVFNDKNQLIHTLEGGIENTVSNPYFVRHGRDLTLAPGHYTLATELISANYLAIPEPYIDDRAHYQVAIKVGNALTFFGLGIFLGLGIYYAALATTRNRKVEAMYAIFIAGNFIFNSAALLVFSDILGFHSIYLVSMPVLLSNIAYILFVMHLLEIKKHIHKHLYWAGISIIAIMLLFLGLAIGYPNWALEFCRYGVAMFLSYGLIAAITQSLNNNATAKRYLIAIGIFFILGLVAISLNKITSQFTYYIEHIGLVSVAVEVILLALVLSFQFSDLHSDKQKALEERDASYKTAYSDALTNLPNRHALTKDVVHLPSHGSLTIVDLDGLKFYNDTYGHVRGDELLVSFANCYQDSLGDAFKLYRIGGDEFAVLSHEGEIPLIENALDEALATMKATGFEFAGASVGSAYSYEAHNIASLMSLSDERMYANKRLRKLERDNIRALFQFNKSV